MNISVLYYIFIAIALVSNFIISIINKNNQIFNKKTVILCCSFETIGIVIGAKLLDIIINIFINGFIFFGGIFGAIFGIYLFSKIFKKNFTKLCEMLMPNLVLIYSISKIGCFFSGCCKGVLLSNGKNLPIQLIESIINFVIYIIIIKNYKNFKNSYQKIGFTCMFFTFFKFISLVIT